MTLKPISNKILHFRTLVKEALKLINVQNEIFKYAKSTFMHIKSFQNFDESL